MSDVGASQVGDGVFWIRAGAKKVAYVIAEPGPTNNTRRERWWSVIEVGAHGDQFMKWEDHRPDTTRRSVSVHFEYLPGGVNDLNLPVGVEFKLWDHTIST